MTEWVYKILPAAHWLQMQADGALIPQGLDASDGFVHLSSSKQVAETLAKHFSGQKDLMLLRFQAAAFGEALRWEMSRAGHLFPHLYAPLRQQNVVQVLALPHCKGDNLLPDDWQPEETG